MEKKKFVQSNAEKDGEVLLFWYLTRWPKKWQSERKGFKNLIFLIKKHFWISNSTNRAAAAVRKAKVWFAKKVRFKDDRNALTDKNLPSRNRIERKDGEGKHTRTSIDRIGDEKDAEGRRWWWGGCEGRHHHPATLRWKELNKVMKTNNWPELAEFKG